LDAFYILAEYPGYDLDTCGIGGDIRSGGEHGSGIGTDMRLSGAGCVWCGEVLIRYGAEGS
jgi:hypothetical protein